MASISRVKYKLPYHERAQIVYKFILARQKKDDGTGRKFYWSAIANDDSLPTLGA
jgi:hypothetical protein